MGGHGPTEDIAHADNVSPLLQSRAPRMGGRVGGLRQQPARRRPADQAGRLPWQQHPASAFLLPANPPVSHTETYNALTVHFRQLGHAQQPPRRQPLSDAARTPARRSKQGRDEFPHDTGLRPTAPEPGFINAVPITTGPRLRSDEHIRRAPATRCHPIKQIIQMLCRKVDADGIEIAGYLSCCAMRRSALISGGTLPPAAVCRFTRTRFACMRRHDPVHKKPEPNAC